MVITFDTSLFRNNKQIKKEFTELAHRIRKYNVWVSLRRYEFRFKNRVAEILLFTMEILSFQLSEMPITINVDKEDEPSISFFSQTVSSAASDELRTTKFKEFKTEIQEVKTPKKIVLLRRITFVFFFLLLVVFSLNYAVGRNHNQNYETRVQIMDLIHQLQEKVPITTRHIRTAVNVAKGWEPAENELIPDRFSFYMAEIHSNSEEFRRL